MELDEDGRELSWPQSSLFWVKGLSWGWGKRKMVKVLDLDHYCWAQERELPKQRQRHYWTTLHYESTRNWRWRICHGSKLQHCHFPLGWYQPNTDSEEEMLVLGWRLESCRISVLEVCGKTGEMKRNSIKFLSTSCQALNTYWHTSQECWGDKV